MYVKIDDDTIYEMLMDRVHFWTDDDDVAELFGIYYDQEIKKHRWNGADFDVMDIVDNDYINNFEYGMREDIMDMFPDFDEDNVYAEHDGLILYYAH